MFYKAKYMKQPAVRLWKRLTALTLCTCMVLTMSPPMTAAAEASVVDSGEVTVISGFAPLPDEVRFQNVTLGVSSVDLVLPDTLEAYPSEPNFEDIEEIPPAESEPEQLPPTASEPEDAESGETDSGTPPQSSSSEAGSTPAEGSSVPESAPDAPPSESREPADDESAGEETQALPDEPAAAEKTTGADEPATQVLSAYVESDSAVAVGGVIWESTPGFDGNIAGTYIFTAVLPDGYAVAEGVAMPVITVRVGQVDRLRELLDALPLPQDATAGMFDPDEAAVAAWKALHSDHLTKAQEALALFDALQADKQAALAPADIEKLEGWRELVALFCTEGGNDSEPLQLEITDNSNLENTPIKEIGVPEISLFGIPIRPEVPGGTRIEINPEKTQYRYQADAKLFPRSRNFYFEVTQAQYDAAIKGRSSAISVRFRGISKGDDGCKFTYSVNSREVGEGKIELDKRDWTITFTLNPYYLKVGTNRLQIYATSGSFYSYNGGVVLNGGLTVDNTSSFNVIDSKKPDALGGGNILFQNTIYSNPAKYKYVYSYYVMRYSDTTYSYETIDTIQFSETVAAGKAKTASHKVNVSRTSDKDTIVDCWLLVYNEAGDVVGSEGIAYRLRPDGLELLLIDHKEEPQPKNKTECTIKVTSTKLYPEVTITSAKIVYGRDKGNSKTVTFDASGKADILLTKADFAIIDKYGDEVDLIVDYTYEGKNHTLTYTMTHLSIDTTPPTIKINPQTFTYYIYTTQTALNKTKAQIEAELLGLVEYSNEYNPADEGEKLSISSNINATAPGKYTATITGKDYHGNASTLTVTVNMAYTPTIVAKPTVSAGIASNPTCTFGSSVTEMGGASNDFGFVVGYGATPTVDACAYNVTATGSRTGFSATQRVMPNVQYYLRAYVKNGADYAYSDQAVPFSCGDVKNFGALTADDLTVLYNHNSSPNILTIPVTRSGGSEGTVTLNCALEGTSKVSLTSPATLTFGNGVTNQNITISLNDQDQFSGSRSFRVKLTNPSPTTINGGDEAVLNVTYSTTNKMPQPGDGSLSDLTGGTTTDNGATTPRIITFTKDMDVSGVPSGSRTAPVDYTIDFSCGIKNAVGSITNVTIESTYNIYDVSSGTKTLLHGPVVQADREKPKKSGLGGFSPAIYNESGSFTLPAGVTKVQFEYAIKLPETGFSVTITSWKNGSSITGASITYKSSFTFEGFTFDNSRTYYPGDVVAIYPATSYAFNTSALNSTSLTVAIGGTSGAAGYDAAKGAYLYTIPPNAPAGSQMLTVSKSGGLIFNTTTAGVANGTATWNGSATNVGAITVGGTSTVAITGPTTGTRPRHTATVTVSSGSVTDARYAWSASATAPATGWQAVPAGGSVTGSGYNGTMYLHVSHTYATGRTSYASRSFAFQQPAFAIEISGGSDTTWQKATIGLNFIKTAGAEAPLTVKMLVDGTPRSCPPDSILISDSGRYTFTATDAFGFSKTIEKLFYIDKEPPTAAAETDAYLSSLTYPALSIPVSFGDTGGSGVGFRGYAFTNSATAPTADTAYATAPATVTYTQTSTTKTATYLHLRVKDVAGHVTTKTFGPFQTQKPPVTVTLPTMTAGKSGANINYAATKGTYDIVMLNGAEYTSGALSGSVNAAECGYYRFDVVDAMGNIAEKGVAINEAGLEKDAPDLSVSVTDNSGNPLGYGTYRPVVKLLIDASDKSTDFYNDDGTIDPGKAYGSGVKTVEVSPDNGATWVPATKGADDNYHYTVPGDGSYLVRVTDQNGNVTTKPCEVKNVDADKPLCSLTGIASGWTTAAQTVTVSYSDAISGINTAQYKIVSDTATKPTTGLTNLPASGGSMSVATNGTSYIYYKVTDKAGNVTDGYSAAIKVDTATPTLTVTGGDAGAASLALTVTPTFGPSGGTVTVSGAATGTVSGGSYAVTAKGVYTFTATANNGQTATLSKSVHAIAFNTNSGSAVTSQLVVNGGKATVPANPTKTGFTFAKWQKSGTDFNFTTDTITNDTTLDAVWTLNAPTVSLAVDKANTTYNAGNTVATLTATPGHTAGGVTYTYEWYRGSTKLTGTGNTMPLTDAAHSGSYTVKVTASAGGLTSTVTSSAVTVTINKADVQIDTAPTASDITYGQALSSSTLTGGAATQKDSSLLRLFRSGTAVPGTFAWTTPATNPAVSDSGSTEYGITFTPSDTANYNTATTTIKLTVGKKMLTPSVATVANREYNGGTDASGTLSLAGAVLGQSPTASGTFVFTSAGVGTNKPVNITGIALDGTWGNNYALSVTSLSGAVTTAAIMPKAVGLEWSGHTGLTYTGSSVNVTATATGLVAPDSCTVTVTGGKQKDAGTHTATAATLDNANYRLPSANTQSYTIAKAPVTFGVTNDTYIYDASAKAATVAQTAGETPDVSSKFTVHYEQSGSTVASPTNKGQYDIIVTITNANFKHSGQADRVTAFKVGTLTIDGTPYPDADTMTWPTAADITYGQTLADSALTGGDQTAKGSYAWKDDTTVPTVTNSGYTVVFTPTDTNYATVEHTVSVSVAKATPTLALPAAAGITYGEMLSDSTLTGGSASATYNGAADTDVPGSYAWTAPDTKPAVSDSDSTDYALTFTPSDTDNYNIVTSGEIKLTVTAKTVGLDWHGHENLVYSAAPVNVTATATGLETGDSCTVTVTNGTETNAGAHTAKATAVSNGNYVLPTAVTQSYTIAKAPVSFVVSGNTHDYDSTAKTATVTQTAGETPSIAAAKFTVSYEKDGSTVASPTNMGMYSVFVELTDPNFKHKNKDDSTTKIQVGLLTINGIDYPDADSMTWPTAASITYGQVLSDSALTGGDQTASGNYAWADNTTVPTVTNSGYTVVFKPTDTNYTPVEHTISIAVAKATPTLTLPTAAGITYGDTLADSTLTGGSASATYNGAANTDVPGSYAWTAPTTEPAVSDSGSTEYGLTFTPADTDNYNVVTIGKVKLAVAQREATLRWSGHTGLAYTGSPASVTAAVTNLVAADSCAVTVTDGAETAAGSYTATATSLANGNYKLPSTGLTQAYTIAKAPVTFAVTANEHNYDAAAKTATVTQTASETPSVAGKFTVSYDKDGSPIAAPTNAGVYDVLVALTDTNFKHKDNIDTVREIKAGTLTIIGVKYPQADSMTWPIAANITYGQTLADSTLTGGDQTAKGGYAWKDDSTIPTVTNSGYTVVFTPTDGNYAPVEHTVGITVAKATPALTLPTAAGITYGATLAESALTGGAASITYNGVANTDVPGKYKWTTPATKPAVADSNSTPYGLTFTPTDTDNYNIVTSGEITLAVTEKTVGLVWHGQENLVYTAAPVNVTATATGLVSGDTCTVTVTDGNKTDAGSYTAKAVALSNPNYKLTGTTEQAYTIAKKPVKVLWSEMFPTYDGTAKSPTVVLEGVVNGEDCTVATTGSAEAGNAGRYKVEAALQGVRSGNYTMLNPGEILAIQPAPVSISLSDYSYKYDGTAKSATVTATPDVPLTVTYKLAGNEVASPTEEGIYDILVALNGKNYRFAEGTDGKARRIGALTIYKEKPPALYTITFAPGAEDAAGTAPTLPAAVKDTVHILPSNSFLRAGHAFVGWKNGDTLYQPGERFIQPANNDTVFTAQWEAATYDIGGVVDQDGKPVANVRVILMRGAEQVAETVTNQIGEYRFDSVLPGLYNLVASKPSPDGVGDIIMTIMAEVKAADVEQANITLPSGKTNSIVEVAPGTPKIIVGNLDQTFKNTGGSDYTPEDKEVVDKGGTVEIKFIAEEKQKSEITGDAEEISKEAGNVKIGLYLALNVEKTVTQPADPSTPDVEPPSDTTPVPETSVLLESVIPLPSDLQGKQSYTVYRVHNGAVDSLTTGADSDERIEVSEDKTTLTLYAQKFSTYAIAYTEKSSGGGGDDDDDGGGSGGGWKPDPIKPEQPAPVAPVIPKPGTDVPGTIPNPTQPGTTQPGSSDADGADPVNPGEDTAQKPDGGDKEALKDEIRDAREDAIKNLPDTLTDEQRQAAIDELTEIADAAIAALDNINSLDEARKIVEQAKVDMKQLIAGLQVFAGDSTGKPFVVASVLFALTAVLLAVFTLLKRQNRRRKLFSAIFATLAVVTFLLTSGWSGFALANGWTLVVAAFAVGTAMGVFVRYSKDEEQPQTK